MQAMEVLQRARRAYLDARLSENDAAALRAADTMVAALASFTLTVVEP